ncbi:amino acid adenylation domain-containing protein [Nostoc sp. UCD121]|uniref:non-ribosomal peptide synthetase n=1 Tax=unclassified Nostoc TaxID=2593658 RepID=UPI0016240F17|nr:MULTISPECIES: non-ribosomal peptide synthetase [unclassified Nostoc]MBC1221786.1 amino acid adenylation domain-containing protein [Nostoc sp. UCD120]MBC1274875.1 amino acid adenylation domain-containing protein [Nostoc sp. UCD121]MBC1293585.1 amino acid adenylation domain-containing protein [Nostoc sp. UCD122]
MLTETINGFRLSPQQKQLWLLQQESSAYISQTAILLEGNLNKDALKAAVQKVVSCHEILRTSFRKVVGFKLPIMVVEDNCMFSWQEIDLSNSATEAVAIELACQNEIRKPFILEQAPLLRASLLQLSVKKHILVITLPALCADNETLKNLFWEISNFYGDGSEKEVVQYAHFSEWQNQLLIEPEAERFKDYWCKQNFSALSQLQLPFQEKGNNQGEFNPESWEFIIDEHLNIAIKAWLKKTDFSLDEFLFSCWQILLWRLIRQSEIIVGYICNGREYEELQNTLGLIAKNLPSSNCLTPDLSFEEVLVQVRQDKQNAYEWQEYFVLEQIDSLSKELPILFDFTDLPEKRYLNGISFSVDQQYTCIDKFKVKLSGFVKDDFVNLRVVYDKNLFPSVAIALLAEQFQILVASAIANPNLPISKLKILPNNQSQQLLIDFNQTQTDYPQDKCIHQLFTEQAVKTPDNIAVVFEDEQLSYRELNNQANQLANYLQQLGVKPDVLVGICLEKSHLSIVAILAVLKAGGAYLPLDPTIPGERLGLMLQDAQVQVLLTQESLIASLPAHTAQVVCLDSCNAAQNRFENPVSSVTCENLAYVIYTSGSTGIPKGVAVEHRQLCNYLNAILEKLDLPDAASFATVSTFAADLGNTVIFSALCTGGCLHIISQERASNPVALAEYCRRHPIDCLKIVPSHLNALLTAANPEEILPSQLLILGGEAASWDLVAQIQQLKPSCQILNHYGPTEATVGVLTYKVEPQAAKSATVPLGRPIANTQIYVLDEHLQPVPISVPGELYIGGANLARGYLNRPELTKERFIPNPFSEREGSRLYKTGDLARYLPDGNIEFLGRSDRQVKIHGFRIELEEVEAILRQHPGIKQAVATVREERLVAYVVSLYISSSDLRRFMQERLPEYMVPTAFVILNAIPLTKNGKVDYKALPAPELASELEKTYIAPRTPQEEQLAKIWSEILGLKQVGIEDNFFELGGDSILSIQVISKANQAGLQLTPKQLFEHQTIAELAAVAETTESIKTETGLVTGEVPLTPIQHWFFAQNLPDPHHWNQSVLLEVRQDLDFQILEQVIKQLLQHHDALRSRFQPTENGWQQINAAPDEIIPVTKLDLSGQSAAEQEEAIASTATELQASLNLSAGPLMRVAYFDFGKDKLARLLIIIHHLVVDGVSWRILLEDLQTAYQQLSQGEEIQLPAKTTAFKQWAEKLSEYAHSSGLQLELEDWQNQTQKQITHLPTDFPENQDANTVASVQTVSVLLSSEETQALLQEVPKAYQTQVNDVLLTALVQACTQWTGDNSLLLTLEGHGREDIFPDVNLSRTVGWFTAQFPVLLSLGDAFSSGDALKTIKEQLRNIPVNGINYGVLKYLSQNRNLQLAPQPQLKFNYLGQFDQVLSDSSIFQLAAQTTGSNRSLQGSRSHFLEIDGMVTDGKLRLDWTYSQNIHHPTTIERLATHFIEALRRLIAHCQSQEAGGYTPSDFPEAELNQTELDTLLAKISQMSR